MSDELVRYFSDVGMFDTTYAAAWNARTGEELDTFIAGWRPAGNVD
jgi:hypothetical protein